MYTLSMNYTYKLNSELIKTYLRLKFLKREYISYRLGVSGDLVKKMMNGHIPKKETLDKLAELIGCPKEQLLIRHGEENEHRFILEEERANV